MTLHEAHPPAPIALDTNLFVRATVRRRPTCASPSARAQRKTAAWTSKTLSGRLRGDVSAPRGTAVWTSKTVRARARPGVPNARPPRRRRLPAPVGYRRVDGVAASPADRAGMPLA